MLSPGNYEFAKLGSTLLYSTLQFKTFCKVELHRVAKVVKDFLVPRDNTIKF